MSTTAQFQHCPGDEEAPYYYPGEDFDLWRTKFQTLREQRHWSDGVAKPFAFAYMKGLAAEAVMDIPYDGPEGLSQFLDAYKTRLQLFENMRILRSPGEELFQGPRGRGSSGMRRRILRLRPMRSLRVPARWLSREKHRGLIVRIETPGGLLEEIAMPSAVEIEEIRKQTLAERARHLLRESENGTPAPSSEDIRNRILFERTRPRPRRLADPPFSSQKDSGPLVGNGTTKVGNAWDFPPGQ